MRKVTALRQRQTRRKGGKPRFFQEEDLKHLKIEITVYGESEMDLSQAIDRVARHIKNGSIIGCRNTKGMGYCYYCRHDNVPINDETALDELMDMSNQVW